MNGKASAIDGSSLHTIIASEFFDGTALRGNSALLIKEGKVVDVVEAHQLPAGVKQTVLEGGILSPGLVDLQVNGGGGTLLINEPNPEAVLRIANAHLSRGTTAILPTVMSECAEVIEASANAVHEAWEKGNSTVCGLHIEGPFFNIERRGAHDKQFIRQVSLADESWLSIVKKLPALVTLAPETVAPERIADLSQAGAKVFAGHTDADAETIHRAIVSGISGFTHLFNAMSGLSARQPGVSGAALASDGTFASVIADGLHVHPDMLQLAFRALGPQRLFLVSDAMATVGAKSSTFDLYGDSLTEQSGRLLNSEGNLAGSAIALADAVKYCITILNWSVKDVLTMATSTPANCMGLSDAVGHLFPGASADMIWLNEDFEVARIWRQGREQTVSQQHT